MKKSPFLIGKLGKPSINGPFSMAMFKKFVKGSLGGETSVLRTFRMSEKELVKEP